MGDFNYSIIDFGNLVDDFQKEHFTEILHDFLKQPINDTMWGNNIFYPI